MGINFATVDWHKKLTAIGIDSNCLKKDAGPCPLCYDGKRGARRFRFDNKGDLGTWYCQSCGAGNGFTLIEKFTGYSKVEILKFLDSGSSGINSDVPIKPFTFHDIDFSPEQVLKNRKRLSEVSAGAIPLNGCDPVSRYLQGRVPGCDLTKISSDVLFHPGLPFYEEEEGGRFVKRGTFPVMVARAVDGSGRPITLHRTYLTGQGTKAPVADPKKQMKGIRKLDGAAIRLVEVPESRTLGLTEGLENGLAVATAYRYRINVWPLLNCVNLSLADLPPGRFDKIIIFADHDKVNEKTGFRPGEHYAKLLKSRLEELGLEVVIKIPPCEGTDFADLWKNLYEKSETANQKLKEEHARQCTESRSNFINRSNPIVRPQRSLHLNSPNA